MFSTTMASAILYFYLKIIPHPDFRPEGIWFFAEFRVVGSQGDADSEIQFKIGDGGKGQAGLEIEAGVPEVDHGGEIGCKIEDIKGLFLGDLQIEIIFSEISPAVIGPGLLHSLLHDGGIPA